MMKESNFLYLLVGLLVLLAVSSLIADHMDITAKVLIPASFAVTIMINVWSLIDEKRWSKVGVGLERHLIKRFLNRCRVG